jgi:4-aminobutyrate aminotransferase-like enzyme
MKLRIKFYCGYKKQMNLASLTKKFGNSTLRHVQSLRKLAESTKTQPALAAIQQGYSNFYHEDSIQPWAAVSGHGPWIMTNENKVVYDMGGYGMLAFGHNPPAVHDALSKEQVMANIMTPNASQHHFWEKLKPEISPHYKSIVCLNSGSEGNTLAMRIANIHKNAKPVRVSMQGSFHGRTDKPAQVSGSCRPAYETHLRDYKTPAPTYFIEPNNIDHAVKTFEQIKRNGEFPEITLLEPVQGEGNPGIPMEPEFYAALRTLTQNAGGLLLADSVQAGWRCRGELSMTRAPGFESLDPPDMETFSKAINGGQFPLSVLCLSEELTANFQRGLYGNTMTGNPRALDVATAVLDEMDTDVRDNIRIQGHNFLENLNGLVNKYPFLTHATGTGLLLALHMDPVKMPVLKVEKELRLRGLNVVHGGKNALRFTPWFHVSTAEIQFVTDIMDDYFSEIEV